MIRIILHNGVHQGTVRAASGDGSKYPCSQPQFSTSGSGAVSGLARLSIRRRSYRKAARYSTQISCVANLPPSEKHENNVPPSNTNDPSPGTVCNPPVYAVFFNLLREETMQLEIDGAEICSCWWNSILLLYLCGFCAGAEVYAAQSPVSGHTSTSSPAFHATCRESFTKSDEVRPIPVKSDKSGGVLLRTGDSNVQY